MKPYKEAVSLVITDNGGKFLAVKRPNDPKDDLAGIWGFPAVTLKVDESYQNAASRVGVQKLGVEIVLGERIGESTHDRGTYTLKLTDYKATIVSGEPRAPQNNSSVTQYSACKYSDDPKILIPAAKKGSQCTQLFLETLGIDWKQDWIN